MLGRGDENALLHQAGGVTDAGHIPSAGFNREAFQVRSLEHDSRSRWRGQNPQVDRRAAMETHTAAGDRSANCLLMCQGEDGVSLLLCISFPRWMVFRMWQNNHTPWFARPWPR